jgi:thiol-disulfide isomerase/thioredoxin
VSLPYKKIELIANVAIIVVAIMLGVVLVKRYLSPAAPQEAGPAAPVGAKLQLAGVEWAKSNQTVVLGLQEGCHFCSESAPFYQRLAAEAARRNVPVVAVLPQPVEVGRRYLDSLHVPLGDVRQATLGSLGVQATPTLMLVNGEGKVTEGWVGKLSPETESVVLGKLR